MSTIFDNAKFWSDIVNRVRDMNRGKWPPRPKPPDRDLSCIVYDCLSFGDPADAANRIVIHVRASWHKSFDKKGGIFAHQFDCVFRVNTPYRVFGSFEFRAVFPEIDHVPPVIGKVDSSFLQSTAPNINPEQLKRFEESVMMALLYDSWKIEDFTFDV